MSKLFFNSLPKAIARMREKLIPLFFGLFLVVVFSLILFINPEPIAAWVNSLENFEYDLEVRHTHKPLKKDVPITIVAIDDKSFKAEEKWPWSRERFADLLDKLYKNGATVVAFDITFPDPEQNIVDEIIQTVKKTPQIQGANALSELEGMKRLFDYDAVFAKSLALGESVLGMVFLDSGVTTGVLPPPFLELTPEMTKLLAIPNKQSFLANINILQDVAKASGFINAAPDPDGVLRFTPLLLRHESGVYASLSLQAVSLYLLAKKIELVTGKYGNAAVLEGIKMDRLFIPTDATGRMLIPHRGPPFSFPYVSVIDVLNDKVARDLIENKLIFIGATASTIGDVRATAVAPNFPGIEVHASVAAGIIDNYLPYKPSWGRGVILFVMLALGVIYALLIPFFEVLGICLLCFSLSIALIFLNQWIWTEYGLVLSTILPITLLFILFLLNLIWGYLFESKKGKELKAVFGQYVPPAYLENMLKKGEGFSLEGESKELSVLFADIIGFTTLSEKLTATELKQLLNRYFTSTTEIIFNHMGTIDKYVGDLVIAFWGAPLEDPKHAFHAVSNALAVQQGLIALNKAFVSEGKPMIKIGVGVNTGVMNVGDMGSKFRRAYTVLGDAVNLASRLESQTRFYHVDVIVGETTYLQTKNEFAYKMLDKIRVKGKKTAVLIYNPICSAAEASGELKVELERHHKGLEAYFNQQWDNAENLFKHLAMDYPRDKELYEVYLNRISSLRQTPPGPDWDGAYTSQEK